MTPEQAAWVRENVLRGNRPAADLERDLRCRCQWGLSAKCRDGQCDRCVAGVPHPETYVRGLDGQITHFAELPKHEAMTVLGPCFTRAAQVWLADRTCRWLCPCPHHTPAESFAQDALFAIPTPTK